MLVLNAKTMEEIARASVDASIHMDLHGYFIPQKDSNWAGFGLVVWGQSLWKCTMTIIHIISQISARLPQGDMQDWTKKDITNYFE